MNKTNIFLKKIYAFIIYLSGSSLLFWTWEIWWTCSQSKPSLSLCTTAVTNINLRPITSTNNIATSHLTLYVLWLLFKLLFCLLSHSSLPKTRNIPVLSGSRPKPCCEGPLTWIWHLVLQCTQRLPVPVSLCVQIHNLKHQQIHFSCSTEKKKRFLLTVTKKKVLKVVNPLEWSGFLHVFLIKCNLIFIWIRQTQSADAENTNTIKNSHVFIRVSRLRLDCSRWQIDFLTLLWHQPSFRVWSCS